MGNIISKMGLYDLFARGVTGAVVLCVADLFGFANILGSGISVGVIILGGYFLGLVLEELSLIREKGIYRKDGKERIGSRKRIEERIRAENPEYDFENCKRALIANDKEIILDEPLAHIVMSSSFKIAFLLLAILKLTQLICYWFPSINILGMPEVENIGVAIFCAFTLSILALIFSQRERHYCERRAKKYLIIALPKDMLESRKKKNPNDRRTTNRKNNI